MIEHYLGLPQNSRQEPDFGMWEPKVVSLRRAPDGTLRVKESMVTGDLGTLVQARTKGRGHGSTSRAFYARPLFVAHILNLLKVASIPRVFPVDGFPLPLGEG